MYPPKQLIQETKALIRLSLFLREIGLKEGLPLDALKALLLNLKTAKKGLILGGGRGIIKTVTKGW